MKNGSHSTILIGKSNFENPTSRKAPGLEHQIVRTCSMKLLRGLGVGIWILPLSFCASTLCVMAGDYRKIKFFPNVPRVSRSASTALEANKGKWAQKNSEFFSGHFDGNHWETSLKGP
jgi:hypothetical protein